MRPANILVALATLCTFSTVSAWPWPPFAQDGEGRTEVIQQRQNNGGGGDNNNDQNNNPSSVFVTSTASQGATASLATESGQASDTNSGSSASQTQSQTESQSQSQSGSARVTTTRSSATSRPSVNPEDPAGGVSMIQPAITSGTQYYCSGAPVTFVWAYTDIVVTPTAIDVIATIASTAGGFPHPTYTLASNQSFDKTQTIIWDTASSIQGGQLPVAMYTLMVYDAANPSGASAVPSAGYLGAAQYAFGIYTHQPVATAFPTSQSVCVTCNAAGGQMEFLAGGLFFTIVGGTIASFLLLL